MRKLFSMQRGDYSTRHEQEQYPIISPPTYQAIHEEYQRQESMERDEHMKGELSSEHSGSTESLVLPAVTLRPQQNNNAPTKAQKSQSNKVQQNSMNNGRRSTIQEHLRRASCHMILPGIPSLTITQSPDEPYCEGGIYYTPSSSPRGSFSLQVPGARRKSSTYSMRTRRSSSIVASALFELTPVC